MRLFHPPKTPRVSCPRSPVQFGVSKQISVDSCPKILYPAGPQPNLQMILIVALLIDECTLANKSGCVPHFWNYAGRFRWSFVVIPKEWDASNKSGCVPHFHPRRATQPTGGLAKAVVLLNYLTTGRSLPTILQRRSRILIESVEQKCGHIET